MKFFQEENLFLPYFSISRALRVEGLREFSEYVIHDDDGDTDTHQTIYILHRHLDSDATYVFRGLILGGRGPCL